MPPSGGKVVRKKVTAKVVAPPLPVPRDLRELAPLDGVGGNLGLSRLEIGEKIAEVTRDLVGQEIAEALRVGGFELDLANGELEALPESLWSLPWLTVLDLSRNRFEVGIFSELARLRELRCLVMDGNLLVGPLPEAVGRIGFMPAPAAEAAAGGDDWKDSSSDEEDAGSRSRSPAPAAGRAAEGKEGDAAEGASAEGLEELSLESGLITDVSALGAHTGLAWLSLRSNQIPRVPDALPACLPKLRHLDLRDNKLAHSAVLPFPSLAACTQLEVLLLSGNALVALPDDIGACAALRVLRADRNALTSVPVSLGSCAALEELDLGSNALAALPERLLDSLPALTSLFLNANKLERLPAGLGAGTPCLEVLSVANNALAADALGPAHLPSLGALARLRECYLDGHAAITALPGAAVKWGALEVLSARGCKLKGLPEGFDLAWTRLQLLDVRGKVKDLCKAPERARWSLPFRCRVFGVICVKPKKPPAAWWKLPPKPKPVKGNAGAKPAAAAPGAAAAAGGGGGKPPGAAAAAGVPGAATASAAGGAASPPLPSPVQAATSSAAPAVAGTAAPASRPASALAPKPVRGT